MESERAAPAIEEADRVVGEESVAERQVTALERDRLRCVADEAAWRDRRSLAALNLFEAHERAVAPFRAKRPAEAGMQAAGVGSAFAAGVGDLDRHAERIGAQGIFDREPEGEGIDGAGALVVAKDEADEVRRCALDGESLKPGEAVQAERVVPPADPRAVARPADDRIEDRADVRPDRRIARPEKVAAAGPPGSRLGAGERDGRLRVVLRQRDRAHSAMPSIAAAEISASLTPGAQAISGLPLVSPSPLRKSLTYPPASWTSRIAATPRRVILTKGDQVPCDLVIVAIGVVPRTELVAGTAVKINRGIVVDNMMQTTCLTFTPAAT